MRLPLVVVLGAVALAVSYNQRMLDPLTAVIAREAAYDVGMVVMLSPAFTLPYALGQPILGPLADAIGKARVLRLSMLIILVASIAAYFATSYWALFGWRFLAGVGAGGIIPVALALIADRTPVERRQVALSHFMSVVMIGQLYVSPLSAWLARTIGWQFNFIVAAGMATFSTALLLWKVKPSPDAVRRRFSIPQAAATYRSILSSPIARACYAAVFVEGVLIFGMVPHIAPYLEQRGFGGSQEAGYVLAAMGVGGMLYAASISFLAKRFRIFHLMQIGTVLIALGIAGFGLAASWPLTALAYGFIGFGFYMLHSGLQTRVTEVMPEARASVVSLHAFSMFIGIASGPPIFGWLVEAAGAVPALMANAVLMLLAGTLAVQFLLRRSR
jgi:predicted MFS family arabinose efflux permease